VYDSVYSVWQRFSFSLPSGIACADQGSGPLTTRPSSCCSEYHFTPTQQWLDHIRLSSVRLNDGGSGSFVSPHGLLLTNHHVARGQLQKNLTAEHDYTKNGF
jgi:S1-C subfamily serine protease